MEFLIVAVPARHARGGHRERALLSARDLAAQLRTGGRLSDPVGPSSPRWPIPPGAGWSRPCCGREHERPRADGRAADHPPGRGQASRRARPCRAGRARARRRAGGSLPPANRRARHRPAHGSRRRSARGTAGSARLKQTLETPNAELSARAPRRAGRIRPFIGRWPREAGETPARTRHCDRGCPPLRALYGRAATDPPAGGSGRRGGVGPGARRPASDQSPQGPRGKGLAQCSYLLALPLALAPPCSTLAARLRRALSRARSP